MPTELCLNCGHAKAEHILKTEHGMGCMAERDDISYCLCDRYQGLGDPDQCVNDNPRRKGVRHAAR